jgi:hypothetical protein
MNTYRASFVMLIALSAPAATASAQQGGGRGPASVAVAAKPSYFAIEAAPVESLSLVKNAPFFAEAVTEFTQVLGNGNRIERRYVSSIARDSRGRTRREEEIALVGPFAATGPSPKLVTIVDPDARVSYTLDEHQRVAYQNGVAPAKLLELVKIMDAAGGNLKAAGGGGRGPAMVQHSLGIVSNGVERRKAAGQDGGEPAATTVVVESLGTRPIEGINAEGTRTTSTIPAGAIGNLLPIEIVTERWFSPELQMAVLITRHDPRAGDTAYRLTNIVRAEPHEALFVVPPGYELRDGNLSGKMLKMREAVTLSPKKK